MKSIIGYYRLGQSYPRTQLREDYPRKKRPFIPVTAAATESTLTYLPLYVGDTDTKLSYSTVLLVIHKSQEILNCGKD